MPNRDKDIRSQDHQLGVGLWVKNLENYLSAQWSLSIHQRVFQDSGGKNEDVNVPFIKLVGSACTSHSLLSFWDRASCNPGCPIVVAKSVLELLLSQPLTSQMWGLYAEWHSRLPYTLIHFWFYNTQYSVNTPKLYRSANEKEIKANSIYITGGREVNNSKYKCYRKTGGFVKYRKLQRRMSFQCI